MTTRAISSGVLAFLISTAASQGLAAHRRLRHWNVRFVGGAGGHPPFANSAVPIVPRSMAVNRVWARRAAHGVKRKRSAPRPSTGGVAATPKKLFKPLCRSQGETLGKTKAPHANGREGLKHCILPEVEPAVLAPPKGRSKTALARREGYSGPTCIFQHTRDWIARSNTARAGM